LIRIQEAGPLMKEYADCYGCEANDVVAWVNDYVNGPWPESLKENIEPTEKERLEAIKGYIEAMVNDSVSRRVKRSIKERKAA
jgi:hypothetical protein